MEPRDAASFREPDDLRVTEPAFIAAITPEAMIGLDAGAVDQHVSPA